MLTLNCDLVLSQNLISKSWRLESEISVSVELVPAEDMRGDLLCTFLIASSLIVW